MTIEAAAAEVKRIQAATATMSALVCFSHLRWDFVFQRPQHLLTRAARTHLVLFFEEPVFEPVPTPELRASEPAPSIVVLTPVLPIGTTALQAIAAQRNFLDQTLALHEFARIVLWYYNPMALLFSDHMDSDVCVYDCMDELSAFKNAPRELIQVEKILMQRADIVFTGGLSLYETKRRLHKSIYPFPSSIDVNHFSQAREQGRDPVDQEVFPHPRIGYFGVIDERLDLKLVADTAIKMPDVQFVMIGPVVKIDPSTLPRQPNLHWIGPKSYADLPSYMRHWNAGWMPFALNESTRYISPTKTPEFLAAGLRVVSTAIVDVVRTYGAAGLVEIADADDIVQKLRQALQPPSLQFRKAVESHLSSMSWDKTWSQMLQHIRTVYLPKHTAVLRLEA